MSDVKANVLSQEWWKDKQIATLIKDSMLKYASRYLVMEKKEKNYAFDSVAHFHLGNGARLFRINWMSDLSSTRLTESFGISVIVQIDVCGV